VKIYVLEWAGLVDLDFASKTIGVYETLEQAIRAAENIGPRQFRDGTLSAYKEDFPGMLELYTPIRRWEYRTEFGYTDEEFVTLSELDLPH